MDSLFGLVGDGFVLMAADTNAARSILVFKRDEDKVGPNRCLNADFPQALTLLLRFS
jgi:hypothetical protein